MYVYNKDELIFMKFIFYLFDKNSLDICGDIKSIDCFVFKVFWKFFYWWKNLLLYKFMNINIFLIISYNFVVFVKFDNKLVCLIFFLELLYYNMVYFLLW